MSRRGRYTVQRQFLLLIPFRLKNGILVVKLFDVSSLPACSTAHWCPLPLFSMQQSNRRRLLLDNGFLNSGRGALHRMARRSILLLCVFVLRQ